MTKQKNQDTGKLETVWGDVDVPETGDAEDVSCTEQGYHEPEDWSGVIAEQGKRHREDRQAFISQLGEPHHIEKVSEYQYGYWRLVGGVIRMTRWGDKLPWDYFSRAEFPDAAISILVKVQQEEPRVEKVAAP